MSKAFAMFRTAYEAKGLLPAARDPFPSPAESAAYLIRNDKFRFPDKTAKKRNWPHSPLNAPWPTLTLLAADNQPLREREDCRSPELLVPYQVKLDGIEVVVAQIKDPTQAHDWLAKLSQTMAGHESYQTGNGRNQTDPCAATIQRLLAATSSANPS